MEVWFSFPTKQQKNNNKPIAEQEPRSAHGRAVKNSGDTSPSWSAITLPIISHTAAPHAMKCKQLGTRYQCMKCFLASKGRLRTTISSTHFGLTPQNANTKKRSTSIDLWPGFASRNLVLTSYPGSVRNVTPVNLFAARYRQISSKQWYHMSSKLHILQYQTQRFIGG